MRHGPCKCVTTSSGYDHNGTCNAEGRYHGFCWYHWKMFKGLLAPAMPGRESIMVVVKKAGVGRIYPSRRRVVEDSATIFPQPQRRTKYS